MTKSYSILLIFFWFSFVTCNENETELIPYGIRGEVTGYWSVLSLNDTLEVYINYENNIHLGDTTIDKTLIPEASYSSFQVWLDSKYARDSSHVYYPVNIECEVINTTNLCFSTKYIVDKAEPSTFRYLGNGYGTDGNELFRNGEIVEGNNGEDF